MSTAPYCNVTVATPKGKPVSPKGIQHIPPNATNQQITNIVNNNFQTLSRGNYVENRSARRAEVVRIFDPADHNSFVDVRQIVAVQFVNSTTGQVIDWER